MARKIRKNFRRFREWLSETVDIYRQIRLDSKYRNEFMDRIEEECADRQSAFSRMNLKPGEDGESLIFVTGVPQEFQTSGQDYMIQDKLNENTYFITDMLKRQAGLNDYISMPEYFHVEDPSNTKQISMTYLAVWHFQPQVNRSLKVKMLSILYGGCAAIAGGLGWLAFVLI